MKDEINVLIRNADQTHRQQRIYRCQRCGRIYTEDSLQQVFRVTGGTCFGDGCDSTEFREHHRP